VSFNTEGLKSKINNEAGFNTDNITDLLATSREETRSQDSGGTLED
jgi:hypothetical protein